MRTVVGVRELVRWWEAGEEFRLVELGISQRDAEVKVLRRKKEAADVGGVFCALWLRGRACRNGQCDEEAGVQQRDEKSWLSGCILEITKRLGSLGIRRFFSWNMPERGMIGEIGTRTIGRDASY